MVLSSLTTKDFGAIYTPKQITTFLCKNTILYYVLDKVNENFKTNFEYKGDIRNVMNRLNRVYLQYLKNVIKNIKILDPAVGIGNFLLEVLVILEELYIYLVDKKVCDWNKYQIREWIITQNLFGVDISQEAIDKCKSRLYSTLDQFKDNYCYNNKFSDLSSNFKCGNSLIGSISGRKDNKIIKEHDLKPFHWNKEFSEVIAKNGFDICLGNPPWNILKPLEKEFFAQFDPRLSKYSVDKTEAKQIIDVLLDHQNIKDQWIKYKRQIFLEGRYFRSKEYHYQSDKLEGVNGIKTISGDLNLYKLFLERIYYLLKPSGYCGVIIPSGIHTDAGTKGLRRLLFDNNEVKQLYSFENRRGIFPSIHKSFKFDLIIFKKAGKTECFDAAFMRRNTDILKNSENLTISVPWEIIKDLSPSSWSILEFKTQKDIELAQKMYQHPSLKTKIPHTWKLRLTREFDISLDSSLFNTEQQGLVVFEGKMIEQYTHQFKEPRYWINEDNIYSKFDSNYKDYCEFRLGFRAVAASTNRRTMIASIIPKNVCCGNSLIVTKIFDSDKNKRLIDESDLLYLCGVFNSFVFDYLLRLKVTTNLNMFFIYDMPVPRLSKNDIIYQEIVANVADLFPEFKTLHKQFGKSYSNKSSISRIQCQAVIDKLVAKIYELNYESIEYILDQFHQKDPIKEEALEIQKNAILTRFN